MYRYLLLSDSTHIPGLMKVLTKLTESKVISTITPGRLYKCASSSSSKLELRLTTSTVKTSNLPNNIGQAAGEGSISQKVLARADSSVQEV